eukprot:scaffold4635_cov267-Pinguiococcus_pyrenoidosus.AAC.33
MRSVVVLAMCAPLVAAFMRISPVMSGSMGSRRALLGKWSQALVAAPLLTVAAKAAYAGETVTTESGLKYEVVKEGTGAVPSPGQSVRVHYTGWLDGFGDEGRKFDSSRDRGRPLVIPAGAGRVIAGWDEMLVTMKVGERRMVVIPPNLGYGKRGAGGVIPPDATLYFDMELLGLQ